MATVLEGAVPKSSILFCVFHGQKNSMQRIFIKKYFLFTVRSVCHVQVVHSWVKKLFQGCLKVTDDAQPGYPVELATEAKTSVLQVPTHW
jgi:hypothetical protein